MLERRFDAKLVVCLEDLRQRIAFVVVGKNETGSLPVVECGVVLVNVPEVGQCEILSGGGANDLSLKLSCTVFDPTSRPLLRLIAPWTRLGGMPRHTRSTT